MYLSRVSLDLHKRATMIALANPQRFHGAVEQAFPGERRRRLWRLDPLGGKLYLMILSEDAPDLSGIEEQFGSGEPGETKSYDPLLERILPDSVWRFRLTANPTVSSASSSGTFRARQGAGPCHAGISRRLASGARRKAWILPEKPASDRVPVAAVPKRAAGKACHTALCRV